MGCGISCRLAEALAKLLATARGNALTITPSQVAKLADTSPQVVGQIFRELAKRGYMKCEEKHRRLKCTIHRDSPLWTESVAIRAILEKI